MRIESKFSIETVAILSVILLCFFTAFYASQVYVHLELAEIVAVFGLLAGLFLSLSALFMPWVFKVRPRISLMNMAYSALLFIWLVALLNAPTSQFKIYFPAFPLLEAELGLGWHQDSSFHVSIINSFVEFGYPSIGQHGTPLAVYHVLSHLVDAIIIRITNVDAWDSYGLFYYLKSAVFISAITFFIATVCKDKKHYVFLLSMLVLMPLVIGTWHSIGSHGLWFPSLLILFSSPYIFQVACKSSPTNRDYVAVYILLILISLGKVSSGFMYATLIGFMLFSSQYRNFRVYVFGIVLVAFFVGYNSLMSPPDDHMNFSGYADGLDFLLLETKIIQNQLYQLYLIISVLGCLAWYFRSRAAAGILFGGIMSVLVLAGLISIYPSLTKNDIWYFAYGLSSVMLLLVYQAYIKLSNEPINNGMTPRSIPRPYIAKFVIFAVVVGLSSQLSQPRFSIFNINSYPIETFYSGPFEKLNKADGELDANIVKQVSGNGIYDFSKYDRPLMDFRNSLWAFMDKNSLERKNSLLYVPKEIYETDFKKFPGHSWARGMLAYAITGVPVLHGLEKLNKKYVITAYDESSLWTERAAFNEFEACKFHKSVIIVESLDNVFSLLDCKTLSKEEQRALDG